MMTAWILLFCAPPLAAFVYGWIVVGKHFVLRHWPVLFAFFALLTTVEIMFHYYGHPTLRFVQGLMAVCVVPWMVVHANECAQQKKEQSLLTKMYAWLFPEIQSLLTVQEKLTAIRRARWKLLERPVTAIGVCLWYSIPWLAFRALVQGQSTLVVVIGSVCAILFLFAGMHFIFRGPIRQHLLQR